MAISFDKAFGIHQYTIEPAPNVPRCCPIILPMIISGLQGSGSGFSAALEQAQSNQSFGLARTNEQHISADVRCREHSNIVFQNQPDT